MRARYQLSSSYLATQKRPGFGLSRVFGLPLTCHTQVTTTLEHSGELARGLDLQSREDQCFKQQRQFFGDLTIRGYEEKNVFI